VLVFSRRLAKSPERRARMIAAGAFATATPRACDINERQVSGTARPTRNVLGRKADVELDETARPLCAHLLTFGPIAARPES
jgi:hypothetical protein